MALANRRGLEEMDSTKDPDISPQHELQVAESRNCQAMCCQNYCRRFMRRENPLKPEASKYDHFKYSFLCPPHGIVSNLITLILMTALLWGVFWSMLGDDMLPGGNLFALFVLVIGCEVAGFIVELVHLPGLLGMLLVGFLLRNIPCINIAKDIDEGWSSALRSIALVVILLRAGLGLDAQALRRLSFVCIRLCCMPCIAEAVTVAVVSYVLLGFPWLWGLMLGFVLGAVTPAVIVPSLLSLQERGYGVEQGIPTLVIAAASCDDVLAISAFGVLLSMAFSTGDVVSNILRGPLELGIGLIYGIAAGLILWYIPDNEQESLVPKRCFFVVGAGLLSVFGSEIAGVPGAGALGCLTVAFIAGNRWKEAKVAVDEWLGYLWLVFEPLLFGLIGAEVSVEYLEPSSVALGLVTLFIGLLVRMVVSATAVVSAGLTMKEKCFVSLAWLPKATVQAAIGSVALETARSRSSEEEIDFGIQLLTIAVLSILITAPLGAILIALSGPRLLRRSACNEPTEEEVELGRSSLPHNNTNKEDVPESLSLMPQTADPS